MSTLTRTNSHNRKPKYKDYVSFLDSYRGGKKDDQSSVVTSDSGVNFSLDSSANNSSSSVFSDVSDGCEVQKKPTKVKSEVFIQISDPTKPQQVFPTQVFKVEVVNGKHEDNKTSVGRTAMIFENDTNNEPVKLGLKPKQNSFRQNSVEEMAKKFETNRKQSNTTPRKSVVKRSPSIGKVAEVFENQPQSTYKPKNFNTVPKPFQPVNLPPSTEVKPSLKPVILSPKPVIPTPTFPKFTSETSYADSIDSALSSLSISPSPPQCPSPPPMSPPPPPMPPSNFTLKLPPPGQKPQNVMSPPPPPMPPANFTFKTEQTYLPPPPPLPTSTVKIPLSPPPPPPPLPPQSVTLQKQKVVTQNGVPKKAANNGTIDKNDPRVKKAVYGALRNMYGAYHDQANDYLATLPKNRVRKNNGLDSIIDSIA